MRHLIILFCISLSLLSCREDSAQPSPSLVGEWQLVGFANDQGQLVDPEPDRQTEPLSIRFTTDSIQSSLDQNDLYGRYNLLDDARLLLVNLIVTEMAGTPRERKLLDNFPYDTTRYMIETDTLVLFPATRKGQPEKTPTVYKRAN